MYIKINEETTSQVVWISNLKNNLLPFSFTEF